MIQWSKIRAIRLPNWRCVVLSLGKTLYAHFSWGQAVLPLWWQSQTKDLQKLQKMFCVGVDRCRVPGSYERTKANQRALSIKEETLLEIILFFGHTITPISTHVKLWSCAPLFAHGLQPTSLFPPSFPTAQATVQPDSSLLQAGYPPSPLLIFKYGLMDLSPPFLVPVVLECMSHAPNATHPIPCPFLLVQLPPASQLKPLPSSKVSIAVQTIWWLANSS